MGPRRWDVAAGPPRGGSDGAVGEAVPPVRPGQPTRGGAWRRDGGNHQAGPPACSATRSLPRVRVGRHRGGARWARVFRCVRPHCGQTARQSSLTVRWWRRTAVRRSLVAPVFRARAATALPGLRGRRSRPSQGQEPGSSAARTADPEQRLPVDGGSPQTDPRVPPRVGGSPRSRITLRPPCGPTQVTSHPTPARTAPVAPSGRPPRATAPRWRRWFPRPWRRSAAWSVRSGRPNR